MYNSNKISTQSFFNYLSQFITLTPDEIKTISNCLYLEEIPAKQYLLKTGKVSNRIGFIINGLIRAFHYDEEGNEIIRCFHYDNSFVCNLQSYSNQIPSDENIETISPSQILFFDRESDEYLSANLKCWLQLSRQVTEAELLKKVHNNKHLLHIEAKQRYINFMNDHATVASQIPLGYLASYLGITQQSLSRIRKLIHQ